MIFTQDDELFNLARAIANFVLSLVALALSVESVRRVYQALFTPLAPIPNAHPLAPFTKAWLRWKRYSGQEHRTRHALHKELGPIVRLGPRELGVNSIDDGVAVIYNGDFPRSDWFEGFVFYGQKFIATMLPCDAHTARRNIMLPVFNKSFIQDCPELASILHEVLGQRLTAKIADSVKNGTALDVHPEMQAVSMDVMSNFTCGQGAGSNFLEEAGPRNAYLDAYAACLTDATWNEYPEVIRWASRFGINVFPQKAIQGLQTIEQFGRVMCDTARRRMVEQSARPDAEKVDWPVVYAHIHSSLAAENPESKDIDAMTAAEVLNMIIAGNDGAGLTLSFLVWELSKRADIQRQLRTELSTVSKTNFSARQVDALPLLEAVLMETMRLYPVELGPPFRVVPPTGTTLCGYADIPPGTVVSATAWSLHRNEQVFPEPEKWNPERWLDSVNLQEMHKWFFAFGVGRRTCFGSYLGKRMIKAFVSEVYSRFEADILDDAGMGMIDSHVGRPAGGKLLVKFRAVQ